MKIFLLDITDDEFGRMPFGRTHSILVRAKDEIDARQMAFEAQGNDFYADAFLDPLRTSCLHVAECGDDGVIHKFSWGDA